VLHPEKQSREIWICKPYNPLRLGWQGGR
jgi:hypothetical protein